MTSLVAESDRRLEPGRPARGKDRRDRAHQGGHEPYEAELHVGEAKIQHVAQQVGEGPADPQGAQGDADHTAQHETERAHHQRLDHTMRCRYQRRTPTARAVPCSRVRWTTPEARVSAIPSSMTRKTTARSTSTPAKPRR